MLVEKRKKNDLEQQTQCPARSSAGLESPWVNKNNKAEMSWMLGWVSGYRQTHRGDGCATNLSFIGTVRTGEVLQQDFLSGEQRAVHLTKQLPQLISPGRCFQLSQVRGIYGLHYFSEELENICIDLHAVPLNLGEPYFNGPCRVRVKIPSA